MVMIDCLRLLATSVGFIVIALAVLGACGVGHFELVYSVTP